MSNLLKSKLILGVMTLAIMFVGVVATNATTASAQACTITSTLRVGSTGAEVQCLQAAVGVSADGKFGPMTAAAVKAWQASKGLVADGVFGPMSRAAFVGGAVSGMFPAGCTSAAGFSTTTGQPCNAVVTGLPAGCTSTAGFSPVTGAPCSGGVSLPAGCTSTAGFSPTTGAKCDGGTAPGPISASGEGSVTVSYAPVPANSTSVDKGQTKNVMALEVKATGSDMKVNRIWLDIGTRAWLAASQVEILDGSTVVATLPLSASTVEEVTVGSSYRLQFNGLNINVPVNTTKTLTFRVTRPELTSNNDDIVVAATSSIRTTDMAGFSETTTIGARTWVMSSATAATGTLTKTVNASSPKARSVSGLSTTAGTLTPVELFRFDLKAEDGTVNVTDIAGTLAATGCTVAECVASVELRDGSTVLSSKTGSANYTFDELTIDVVPGTTKTLSVWGQVNAISATLEAGESVIAAIGTVTGTSGPSFSAANATGTITGNSQYFYRYAPAIALSGTPTAIGGQGSTEKEGHYTIAFSVTAPAGSDIYVGTTGVVFDKTTSGVGGTLTSSAPTVTGDYTAATAWGHRVHAGGTATFSYSAKVVAGTAGFTGVKITEIDWNTTDTATADVDQTWGLEDLKTAPAPIEA